MNIFNIPSYFNFLKSLHDFIINKCDNKLLLSNITVLLPSRRSCNELKRLFLENANNQAIILPNIRAIGDIDYDDILLKQLTLNDIIDNKSLCDNTSRIKYKILLIKELLKWIRTNNNELFDSTNIEQVSDLALELEKFLNEVNRNNLDLTKLENIVDNNEYSEHWQRILNFLEVFSKKWNKFIKDNNIISIVDFKTKMIELNAKYFEKNKPLNPIIIANVVGNTVNTCNFIKNIIQYDNCYFIFKGLDKNLTDEEWKKINVFHPQYSFKKLLENCISVDRRDIKDLKFKENILINKNIETILTYSMLPYSETYKWQEKLNIKSDDFSNISKIECKNIFDELSIISLITKYHYELNNGSTAIITSNDVFASQLEIELKNYGLSVNNVFGNKISKTEIVKFLFLILDVIKNNYETISLLSLLKHNFTLFGYDKRELNDLIFILEENILRGTGKLDKNSIIQKIKLSKDEKLETFLNTIIKTLDELKFKNVNFSDIVKTHLKIAEQISFNGIINNSNNFWNNEINGNELLNFFNELISESEEYGVVDSCDEYSCLLNYLIAENSYSDKYYIHPMINIISPQEAKLINYDLVIISNLNDGEFPLFISTDPWMSKSMRKAFGLPDKEELIGNSAYDFTQLLTNKKVILTRSLKEDGVPTTESKYLLRLETFLSCQNLSIKAENIWQNVLETINKVEKTASIKRPLPTPPLNKRPRELYATGIEKLINNPYDIYAEKILQLKAKEDFYENKAFLFFGSAVHEAIELYTKNYIKDDKEKLCEKLTKYGQQTFNKYFTDDANKELFFIRFLNIVKWFVNEDENIRLNGYKVYSEETKHKYFKDIDFTLSAKIDRIDENEYNSIDISDYKTGSNIPNNTNILNGKKPQLTIEAIILSDINKIDKIAYWSVKGKNNDYIKNIDVDIKKLVEKGENGIKKLIAHFNIYENCYIATTYDLNNQNSYQSDYKHLSRVDEWGYL